MQKNSEGLTRKGLIRFLFHFYNLDERAGIQRAVCELSNALVEAGHEVVVASNSDPAKIAFPLDGRVVVEQIVNPEVRPSGPLAWPSKVRWATRQFRKLREIAQRHEVSIVVDHGTALGLIYPFQTLGGKPFVLQRHFPVAAFPHGKTLYRILSLFSPNRPVVVLTAGIASELRASGFRNVLVIPNTVPANALRQAYSDAVPRTGLLIGRAKNPQKGFDLFLLALAKAKTNGWSYTIAGPGVDSDPLLLDIVKAHALEDRVKLLPSSPDPYELIRRSSCLIMPSRYEALPMVALEALAIGRPILASDADGLRDLVQHEINGLVFPREDVDVIAATLERVCADPGQLERLAEQASASVSAYRRERIVAQWVNLVAALRQRA